MNNLSYDIDAVLAGVAANDPDRPKTEQDPQVLWAMLEDELNSNSGIKVLLASMRESAHEANQEIFFHDPNDASGIARLVNEVKRYTHLITQILAIRDAAEAAAQEAEQDRRDDFEDQPFEPIIHQ